MKAIPVIDLFAGPGGLGEGFSSELRKKQRAFNVALSIEMDPAAYKTLALRSFFRQFPPGKVPNEYYANLQSESGPEKLQAAYPLQWSAAQQTAWLAELGQVPAEVVDERIRASLRGAKQWVLIGGPPCQAYSVIGRSRNRGIDPKDPRVYLYREYYRILAVHNPPVFVMENVKGLLSAEVREKKIIRQILHDLGDPASAFRNLRGNGSVKSKCPGYKIYSLVTRATQIETDGRPDISPEEFVIESERYGIPQARHRLILLGIRNDLDIQPDILTESDAVNVFAVIRDMPRLRGGISDDEDTAENWKKLLAGLPKTSLLRDCDPDVIVEIQKVVASLQAPQHDRGSEFIPRDTDVDYAREWYLDNSLHGLFNHTSRAHMTTDLYRYMFAACFAKVKGGSPKLSDFPRKLLPKHENVKNALTEKTFADRFRVQLWDQPARTVTSHISKDGHYYIHPDPSQCRSLTVREAARLQTFPDNYFFCGPRTEQYIQVGNAVPPLLAKQIAEIVLRVMEACA